MNHTRRVVLLSMWLVLSGCATSGQSREYHDGMPVRTVPVFVTPGYTPAGAGLPEYMPGMDAAPAVPRGKDRRVLPETPQSRREPGIWASDDERRARPVPSVARWQRTLFGIELPLVEENPPGDSARLTNGCAAYAKYAAKLSGQDERALALPEQARACIAAKLFVACAKSAVDRHEQLRSKLESYDPALFKSEKAVEHRATEFEHAMCNGRHWTGEMNDIYTVILNRQETGTNVFDQ